MATFQISTDTSIQAAIIKAVQNELGEVSVQTIGSEESMKIVIDDSIELSTEQETTIQESIASIYSARGFVIPTISKESLDAENITVESIDSKV